MFPSEMGRIDSTGEFKFLLGLRPRVLASREAREDCRVKECALADTRSQKSENALPSLHLGAVGAQIQTWHPEAGKLVEGQLLLLGENLYLFQVNMACAVSVKLQTAERSSQKVTAPDQRILRFGSHVRKLYYSTKCAPKE